MGRAVGYSREQIARLENGSRMPDLAVVAALFVPALFLEQETPLVEQFLTLAGRRAATSKSPSPAPADAPATDQRDHPRT